MSFNLKAICDALAAKYAPGTLATPTGATAIRRAYAQQPVNVPSLPCVVVTPKNGQWIGDSSPAWHGKQYIDAVFIPGSSTADLARIETERQLWLPNLLFAAFADTDLGQTGDVKTAFPASWEFAQFEYGGTEYPAVIIHYEVMIRSQQAWTP